MTEDFYLTDRQNGVLQLEELPRTALEAFIALVESKLKRSCFAQSFPELCDDGDVICGTDIPSFSKRLNGEMKGLSWPVNLPEPNAMHFPGTRVLEVQMPTTEAILEMLEFCFHHFHQPAILDYHKYLKHYHMEFPSHDDGKHEFTKEINRLFHRNELPYKMNSNGKIEMQFNPAQEGLLAENIPIIEGTVTNLINEAVSLLRKPKGTSHQTAIEKLWDAFERTKGLAHEDKKKSVEVILKKASDSDHFFSMLNDETMSLTTIGNQFQIRHSEINKTPLTNIRNIEYLFFRMYALIKLMLEALEQPRSAV